jgi:hypothetical protein
MSGRSAAEVLLFIEERKRASSGSPMSEGERVHPLKRLLYYIQEMCA